MISRRNLVRWPLGALLLPAALAAMLLTGCFESNTVQCSSGVICPEGFACTADGNSCRASSSTCGNGEPDPGEACDDGNQINDDMCKVDCSENTCGDGVRDTLDTVEVEACDTGGESATCDDDCSLVVCGDDNLNENSGEVCDVGDILNDDGCRFDCRSDESCGNGLVDDHLDLNAMDDPAMCAGDATTPRPGCREACDTMNPDGTANPLCSPNCLSHRVCGDFIRDTSIGEVCDDGNTDSGDTCSSDCHLLGAGCGNNVVDGDVGEECDTGLGLDMGGNPIDTAGCIDCKISYCGDARTNPLDAEDCDPGLVGVNTPTCDLDCTFPACNDLVYNPIATPSPEACDATADVGAVGGFSTTCDNDCSAPSCGDAVENNPAGEECDPGAVGVNTIACNSDCTDASCGDRFLNPARGETCDDGDPLTGLPRTTASCDLDCTAPVCGDTVINTLAGETCDPGTVGLNTPTCDRNCTAPACGDNVLNRMFMPVGATGVEACDDGNTTNGDGCSSLCQIETCGDGITQTTNGEVCDDGNTNDLDACRNSCSPHVCGDSVDSLAEACDTGGDSTTCDSDCTLPVCNDGHVNIADGEECDDGFNVGGDGCSAGCLLEPFALSVTRAGTGVGSVTSSPAGINCGTDCSEPYAASTVVTLTAAAGTNSVFTGWSGGGCTGTGTCMVTMNGAKGVVATFELNTLLVIKAGNGGGTVTGTGISCGADCTEAYPNNTSVTLTAVAAANSAFAGWVGGGCSGTGTCVTIMTSARSITATFTLNVHTLTVVKAGNGSGTVVSVPSGINCGATCAAGYDADTVVTLSALPTANNTFTGWSGAGCSGTGTCVVTMTAAQSVTATFVLNVHQLSVVKTGNGTGTVSSSPSGISCGADCTEGYNAGTPVTLTASADGTSTFTGWSGAGCTGTGTCLVTVTAAASVTATFTLNQFTLSTTRTGTGTGTITSVPTGITCGGDCSELYNSGTLVTLTATDGSNSTFTGWSGACTGSGTCTVTMNASQTVNANFDTGLRTLTVVKAGNGTGTVTSSPPGIACGASCAAPFAQGSTVTLTSVASLDSVFTGWSGSGCSGTGTCVVVMNNAASVTATYTLNTHLLTVLKVGSGVVNSVPTGIGCGGDCTEPYNAGTLVALVATAGTGFTFTGWSGGGCTGTGLCFVTITAPTTVTATFTQNTHVLTVARTGAGTGTVTSSPGSISCGATCTGTFNSGTVVVLTATATAATSTFTGWSGAGCSGTGTCSVTMNQAETAVANFALLGRVLTVTKAGTAASTGSVTAVPSGLSCAAGVSPCTATYDHGTVVALTATAGANSTFTGWSGGCTGTGTCVVTMSAPVSATATFVTNTFALNVTLAGTGTGTVTSAPAGISCGATCAHTYDAPTSVTLTAAAAPVGSVFTGWSGDCSGTGTCVVAMTAIRNVTATFDLQSFSLTVTPAGTGAGTVTANTGAIACPGTCTDSYPVNTAVTLTANAAPSDTFTGWSGADAGACTTSTTCIVSVSAAKTIIATFTD